MNIEEKDRCMRHCNRGIMKNLPSVTSPENAKLVLEYFLENGDIPEYMYEEMPRDHKEKFFGFSVASDGIVITLNTYSPGTIMLEKDENEQITIHTSELGIAFALASRPDAKRMYLDSPAMGKVFFFSEGELSREDFNEGPYMFINGQLPEECHKQDEIDLTIYKGSVITANLHGIQCKTVTFRRTIGFEHCYKILVDVSGKASLSTDYTVSADALVRGFRSPILADALKPQSIIIDTFLGSPYYHRELVFTKDPDGCFSDYNIKTGLCAIKDTKYTLELATTL